MEFGCSHDGMTEARAARFCAPIMLGRQIMKAISDAASVRVIFQGAKRIMWRG